MFEITEITELAERFISIWLHLSTAWQSLPNIISKRRMYDIGDIIYFLCSGRAGQPPTLLSLLSFPSPIPPESPNGNGSFQWQWRWKCTHVSCELAT